MQERRLKDALRTSMYMDLFPMVRTDDIPESDLANAIGLPNRPTALVVVPLSRALVGTFQDMRQACEDLVDAGLAHVLERAPGLRGPGGRLECGHREHAVGG